MAANSTLLSMLKFSYGINACTHSFFSLSFPFVFSFFSMLLRTHAGMPYSVPGGSMTLGPSPINAFKVT